MTAGLARRKGVICVDSPINKPGLFILVALLTGLFGLPAWAQPAAAAGEYEITGLFETSWGQRGTPKCILGKDDVSLGINSELWVQVAVPDSQHPAGNSSAAGTCVEATAKPTPGAAAADSLPAIDAARYALFLNGSEVKDLGIPVYRTYAAGAGHPDRAALVFRLKRTSNNKDLWTDLLGSPTLSPVHIAVGLGVKDENGKVSEQTIKGDPGHASFDMRPISGPWLLFAALVIAGLIWLVFARAGKSTTLRDNLLPQIEPRLQTYSLARCQMAFWFVLTFCSFVFLFVLLWDYNTISSQALQLMGISGATALAAVAVDVAKDSPADAVNRGLQALGLHNYDDVQRLEQEIADRQTALALAQVQLDAALNLSDSVQQPELARLQQDILKQNTEILGRQGILRTYRDKTRPFLTQGWFKDLTTDLNGTAIHRLQVFCWTLVLGVVFIIGVYRDLAMPEFSGTLLALMAVSSAGYVGFKYPEKNN